MLPLYTIIGAQTTQVRFRDKMLRNRGRRQGSFICVKKKKSVYSRFPEGLFSHSLPSPWHVPNGRPGFIFNLSHGGLDANVV